MSWILSLNQPQRRSKMVSRESGMKTKIDFFPLLIGGREIDTGEYNYLVFADEMIKDPVAAIKLQRMAGENENNPSLKQKIFAKYCIAHENEIEAAIDAAFSASKEFRNWSFARRVRVMNDIYELLLEKKHRLLDLMIAEGHPEKLALWEFEGMEIAYRPECISFFKTQLRGLLGNYDSETLGWIRKADGVIAVSPPGNASPSNSMTAGFALLGGNTLIVKPPLRSPTATLYLWHEIFWQALKANNGPKGTINTLVGNSDLIMRRWLASPKVNDIFFFGDSLTGLKVGSRVFEAGKKPILELSGNDVLIVWKDGDIEMAAESLADAFLGSTQICMVPKKALIHEDVYKKFEIVMQEKVENMKCGLPSEKDVVLTPVVKMDEFFEFLKDALDKGAELICGGKRVNYDGFESDSGTFLQPTLLRVDDWTKALTMKCVLQENFFPLIPLIKVTVDVTKTDFENTIFKSMIDFVNQNQYGLRTSVWVSSNYYAAKFIKHLDRSGLLRINSRHTGFSPFLTTHGGPGLSGGPFGEANYVWQKTTHLQSISVTRLLPLKNKGK